MKHRQPDVEDDAVLAALLIVAPDMLLRPAPRKCNLQGSHLRWSNLSGWHFPPQANIIDVSFRGANLSNADLRDADLHGADPLSKKRRMRGSMGG